MTTSKLFGRCPPKMVQKTPEEIHKFLAQYGVRNLSLSMHLHAKKRYHDAHIAWGKYRMARIIEAALFPHDDDKGKYTFNYLIQKIDCQLDEFENESLKMWEQKKKEE